MGDILQICAGIAVLVFFIWLMSPSAASKGGSAPASDDQPIDPTDSLHIGILTGLMGGSIADAATTRFALQRFEEMNGRKATVRDMGVVAGLMSSMR